MKAKKGLSKSKRVIISAVAALCALSSSMAISVNAVQTREVILTNSNRVKATLDATTTKANTRFDVISGGPRDLETRLIVSYKTKNNTTKTYDETKSACTTNLVFNMAKPSDFSSNNKVEAYYHNAFIPSSYKDNTIGLYEYF